MDSNICVATITTFLCALAFLIISFCTIGTRSGDISIPKSPRATIIPDDFKLYNNYPNPFNPVTKIRFNIPNAGKVIFSIYDMLGNEIFTINENNLIPGIYEYQFDGSNYPSGIYFYRLISGNFSETKKMVLIK